MKKHQYSNLGTHVRHLIELLDGDVAESYNVLGLDNYKPRYTSVFRALIQNKAMSIKQLTQLINISQPAITQTVNEMEKRKLITRLHAEDARERKITLTAEGLAMVPKLEMQWEATLEAENSLEKELPNSLIDTVNAAIDALTAVSFKQRMAIDKTKNS
jgi:DNA-binding MarR family transcriptional regulator